VISLPITLVILLLAFGAVVAAARPLLLGLTSVAAAMGAFAVISQVAPDGGTGGALVVLIGLAVGVDYSLFYIRREREERRAGKSAHAALDAAAATIGRAVVISGVTVMVALAGLLFTGLAVFTSMALATIVVVAIAVVGSITVLPATLALLGDRIDKGRIPFLGRRRRAGGGAWGRLASTVTKHPVAALVSAVCLLGTLTIPALDLRPASSSEASLPAATPVLVAQRAIERAFPGAPSDAELVVTARGLDARGAQTRLQAFGERAREVTGGRGAVSVDVSRDGRTAVVSVPRPDRGVGLVLGLAFLLLVGAFRSPRLAAAVIALNLLSVGAAYGVLAAVFQHHWAEGLLGFTSTGTVADWLPLFAFVILFGLSMDYTILVLERVREGLRAGRSAREAAAEGVAATAGTVTSAAIVMVAVFAIFATMQFADNKQLGVGLSVAILLDATIVRGVALPAAIALIGDRGPRGRARRRVARGWDGRPRRVAASGSDAR
jgi:uncharacterized membrane protein YdfJ with MMPL/SSD domain